MTLARGVGLLARHASVVIRVHTLEHGGPGRRDYAVVPWKRGRGIAARALGLMLDHARAEGLAHVEITTDLDNVASRMVIEANCGRLMVAFRKPAAYGGKESLRYRINTSRGNPP